MITKIELTPEVKFLDFKSLFEELECLDMRPYLLLGSFS